MLSNLYLTLAWRQGILEEMYIRSEQRPFCVTAINTSTTKVCFETSEIAEKNKAFKEMSHKTFS